LQRLEGGIHARPLQRGLTSANAADGVANLASASSAGPESLESGRFGRTIVASASARPSASTVRPRDWAKSKETAASGPAADEADEADAKFRPSSGTVEGVISVPNQGARSTLPAMNFCTGATTVSPSSPRSLPNGIFEHAERLTSVQWTTRASRARPALRPL
jgi:hypothetical protein